MAITLETIAAPGATPIANNAASAKSFQADYFKLVQGQSTRDQKTIWILGLIYKLTNAGGANYKLNHKGLMQDAQVYTGGISQFQLVAGMAATGWSAGKAADATLSTDIPTLLNEGRDIQNKSDDELDRILVFLRAQLGI